MDTINDAMKAAYIIDEDYDKAAKVNSRLKTGYFTTNENLGYLKQIDISDKKVLTVCGSGDQAFMCLINGAQEVDTFDCNPLQYYILELKKAAIMGLEKDEYLQFFPLFGGNINEMYNVKYYDKFKQYLDLEARKFWDYIYSKGNYSLYLLQIFSYSIEFESDYTRHYYLLKEAFNKARINFKLDDICHISKSLNNNTYKLIILSNVFDHLYKNKEYNECYEEEYYKMVKENFYPLLEDGGICVYHIQLPCMPFRRFKNYPGLENVKEDIKVIKK